MKQVWLFIVLCTASVSISNIMFAMQKTDREDINDQFYLAVTYKPYNFARAKELLESGRVDLTKKMLGSSTTFRVMFNNIVRECSIEERGEVLSLLRMMLDRGAVQYEDGKSCITCSLAIWDHSGNSRVDKDFAYQVIELLLSKGANPNCGDLHGDTPLLAAVKYGDASIIELLLSKGADPNCGDLHGDTPLLVAVRGGRTDMIETLILNGANWRACANGDALREILCHVVVSEKLKSHPEVNVNMDELNKYCVLAYALSQKKPKTVIEKLVCMGVNVNQGCQNIVYGGQMVSPLTYAIRNYEGDECRDIVALLRSRGAVEALPPSDLVHEAQLYRSLCVQSMSFVDPQRRDNAGNTMLHLVAQSNDPGLVLKFFLRPGVDFGATNNRGQTAMDVASNDATRGIILGEGQLRLRTLMDSISVERLREGKLVLPREIMEQIYNEACKVMGYNSFRKRKRDGSASDESDMRSSDRGD